MINDSNVMVSADVELTAKCSTHGSDDEFFHPRESLEECPRSMTIFAAQQIMLAGKYVILGPLDDPNSTPAQGIRPIFTIIPEIPQMKIQTIFEHPDSPHYLKFAKFFMLLNRKLPFLLLAGS